jgi:signal transduction histidine kinase
MLDEAIGDVMLGIDELRELARGIHPAVLTQRGLAAAVESLANRAPVPVEVRASLPARLPAPIETAAYFAVSEALANVAKHARAGHVVVELRHRHGRVLVDVTDDGRGGASAASGSGLRGLADRVGALDGRMEIHSAAGAGTHLHVEIPCPAAPDAVAGSAGTAELAEICRELARFQCERFRRRE